MATFFISSCKAILLLALFSSLKPLLVYSLEFEVGDDNVWAIPSKNDQAYNQWASKHRFQVNDTISFKYGKDSVMEVTEEEYDKCLSSHPIFFSNNGDTVFKFNRSGLFYFISGVSGHCERGQKMIIKVLETETSHPPPSNQNSTTPDTPDQSGAIGVACIASTIIILQFIMSIL